MHKISYLIAVTALCAAGTAGASTLPDFSAPGIPEPGNPSFTFGDFSGSLIGSQHSGYTLSIVSHPGSGAFNIGSATYAVNNEAIVLTAHFNSQGQLTNNPSNTVVIFGSISGSNHPLNGTTPSGDSWSAQPFEELFGANLTGVGQDAGAKALGFSTDDFSG